VNSLPIRAPLQINPSSSARINITMERMPLVVT
jgi:hypothetical protein